MGPCWLKQVGFPAGGTPTWCGPNCLSSNSLGSKRRLFPLGGCPTLAMSMAGTCKRTSVPSRGDPTSGNSVFAGFLKQAERASRGNATCGSQIARQGLKGYVGPCCLKQVGCPGIPAWCGPLLSQPRFGVQVGVIPLDATPHLPWPWPEFLSNVQFPSRGDPTLGNLGCCNVSRAGGGVTPSSKLAFRVEVTLLEVCCLQQAGFQAGGPACLVWC